jgi:hypothetical protein
MIPPMNRAGKPLGIGALAECCTRGNEKPQLREGQRRLGLLAITSVRLAGDQSRSQMITAASGRPIPNDQPMINASPKSKPTPARNSCHDMLLLPRTIQESLTTPVKADCAETSRLTDNASPREPIGDSSNIVEKDGHKGPCGPSPNSESMLMVPKTEQNGPGGGTEAVNLLGRFTPRYRGLCGERRV